MVFHVIVHASMCSPTTHRFTDTSARHSWLAWFLRWSVAAPPAEMTDTVTVVERIGKERCDFPRVFIWNRRSADGIWVRPAGRRHPCECTWVSRNMSVSLTESSKCSLTKERNDRVPASVSVAFSQHVRHEKCSPLTARMMMHCLQIIMTVYKDMAAAVCDKDWQRSSSVRLIFLFFDRWQIFCPQPPSFSHQHLKDWEQLWDLDDFHTSYCASSLVLFWEVVFF